MTGHGDTRDSAEQMRAGFQGQGGPGLLADAAREVRQKRIVHTVIGGFVIVGGLVATIFRLVRGDAVGAWTGFYLTGMVLAALGVVLTTWCTIGSGPATPATAPHCVSETPE